MKFSAALSTLSLSIGLVFNADSGSIGNSGCPWPATDALGRKLPTYAEANGPRTNQFVGIFYFLWHEPGTAKRSPEFDGPFDVSKILAREPDALNRADSALWGNVGVYHYWGEPLYGYYLSNDPWVIRRHAHLLSDAGIDVIVFDTTNALTYRDVYLALCEVFHQIRQSGDQTPQIAFMVNTQARETAERIYEELYKPAKYPELWFQWEGKPLLLCDPGEASEAVRKFFTLRKAHWPFDLTNTLNAWHWEATHPQPYSYNDDPGKPEQLSVSAAQNLRAKDGKVTNMSFGDARGRSFRGGKQESSPEAVAYGYNFQEQWERALELRPPFVLITSWNEWIAGRWGKPGGPLVFVDQLNQEFSRDIEPMKGGHGDNYYLQMVSNVRRLKGVPPIPVGSEPRSIEIERAFAQWAEVRTEFADHVGETRARNFSGAAGLHYTNNSGRNDFVLCKVAHARGHVYFYARFREDVRLSAGADLRLLLDADQEVKTGWAGYDYRISFGENHASLERYETREKWISVGTVPVRIAGPELQAEIGRKVIGLPENGPFSLDFKWTDALNTTDVLNFYCDGDVAPESRFNYRYTAR